MPSTLITLTALLLAASVTVPNASIVPDSELAIGHISLGDTESTVVRRLGPPTSIAETGDFLSVQLNYTGLTIWLGEGRRVGEILSTSPEHCTTGGICPGMDVSEVLARFGPAVMADREHGRFHEYFPESDSPCWLQVAASAGVVVSIRSECQP